MNRSSTTRANPARDRKACREEFTLEEARRLRRTRTKARRKLYTHGGRSVTSHFC